MCCGPGVGAVNNNLDFSELLNREHSALGEPVINARQFSDFYNSLNADPAKRGKQFEHFVKWFLKVDPVWSMQVDQVWLWDKWPDNWGRDCGIDLVFRHKNGEFWAVQAKCYSREHYITKHDVDKFLSESGREIISHRLLIATTDLIGSNARQAFGGKQTKPVTHFLFSDFERAEVDYPANFAALPQAKRKPRPEPRDHQVEARAAVVLGLQTADRGQLIMACGTGKTYVTLWIKKHLDAQRTLVLHHVLLLVYGVRKKGRAGRRQSLIRVSELKINSILDFEQEARNKKSMRC